MEEKRELTIERVFDSPQAKVWDAWTNPEIFKKWWGPHGFTSPVCEMDFNVGGKYLWCMEGHIEGFEGKKMYSAGEFLEIMPIEKIVYTDNFSDENGNVVPMSYYGMGDNIAHQMKVTVLLQSEGEKTKMTLISSEIEGMSDEDLKNMNQGWNESFDKLAESIK